MRAVAEYPNVFYAIFMQFDCKVWVSTTPQVAGPASVQVRNDGQLIDPLQKWPVQSILTGGLEILLSGDRNGRELLARLASARGSVEIVRCEIAIASAGDFRGQFQIRETESSDFAGQFYWRARILPDRAGAVRFAPLKKVSLKRRVKTALRRNSDTLGGTSGPSICNPPLIAKLSAE